LTAAFALAFGFAAGAGGQSLAVSVRCAAATRFAVGGHGLVAGGVVAGAALAFGGGAGAGGEGGGMVSALEPPLSVGGVPLSVGGGTGGGSNGPYWASAADFVAADVSATWGVWMRFTGVGLATATAFAFFTACEAADEAYPIPPNEARATTIRPVRARASPTRPNRVRSAGAGRLLTVAASVFTNSGRA
jgi:hypothetical protein